MFVRKKPNKSGVISIQVIDKSSGKYKLIKTIGSSSESIEIERLVQKGKEFIKEYLGLQEFDFKNYDKIYAQVLSSISSHKLVRVDLVLGNIFNEIGFNRVEDELFRDLVLYCLVYPKSKLKTTKIKKSELSAEKVIEIAQSILEIEAKSADNKTYKRLLLTSEEHLKIQKLFDF
jgi:hypothetical protein